MQSMPNLPPTPSGFVRYEGTYKHLGARYKWVVLCDELVLDFRWHEHEPTTEECIDVLTRGRQWYFKKIPLDPYLKKGFYILCFEDSEPRCSNVGFGRNLRGDN